MNAVSRARWQNLPLAALAAVSVLLVLMTQGSVTTADRLARRERLLEVFTPSAVTRIAVESPKSRFALRRIDSSLGPNGEATNENAAEEAQFEAQHWRFEGDLQVEAEPDKVDRLLSALQYAGFARRLEGPVDRKALGLDEAEWVLFADVGQTHYRLRLGSPAGAPKGAHYLELSGENVARRGVYVIHRRLVEDLSVSADDFRARLLVPPTLSNVEHITLTRPESPPIDLQRERSRWFIKTPNGKLRADRERVERLLANLARFDAEPLLESHQARQLVQSGAELTLASAREPEPLRLRIGAACPDAPDRVAVFNPSPGGAAGCVPGSAADAMTSLSEESLTDDRLFYPHADEIETLLIEPRNTSADAPSVVVQGATDLNQRKLELVRDGAGFRLREPDRDVDAQAAEAKLAGLASLRGELYGAGGQGSNPRGIDLDAIRKLLETTGTRIQIGMRVEGKEITEQVLVGQQREGEVWVLRQDDNALLSIAEQSGYLLEPGEAWLLPRRLLDTRLANLRQVRITTQDVIQDLVRQDTGNFTLEEPKGFTADGTLAAQLGEGLTQLEAERWVSGSKGGSWGLERPEIEVKLQIIEKGQPQDYRLSVGARTRGGRFARFSKFPGVFVLGNGSIGTLTTLVIDRGGFQIDRDTVRSISFETTNGQLTLERSGEHFETRPRGIMSQDQIEAVIDLLSALRPEAAIHTGPASSTEALSNPVLRISIDETLAGKARKRSLSFGARDVWRQLAIHYARNGNQNATFAVPRSMVTPLLELPIE